MGASRLLIGRRRGGRHEADLQRIVHWYFRNIYSRHEGPGVLPFYCDLQKVGHFAVEPERLAEGDEKTLFRLCVTLAMYQARRDVVIMRQQAGLSWRAVALLASSTAISRRVRENPCPLLSSLERFESSCSVRKEGSVVTCVERPRQECHVKEAAVALNRMADLGKLPTSAWLRLRQDGGFRRLLLAVSREAEDPTRRADLLVARLSAIWRVGRKLATMFVSALSVPTLAPGLTPWFPLVDGNELVVVDTNVERGLGALLGAKTPRGYQAVVRWFREAAAVIDLRGLAPGVPEHSPRLVQQAVYSFCSRSNRVSRGDACVDRLDACEACVPSMCPLPGKPRPSAARRRDPVPPCRRGVGPQVRSAI